MEADDRHAAAGGQEIDCRPEPVAELVELSVDGDPEGLEREGRGGRTFAPGFAAEPAEWMYGTQICRYAPEFSTAQGVYDM